MQSKSESNGIASPQCYSKFGDSSFHMWCSIASSTSLSLIDSPVSVRCFHHGERWLFKLQPSNLHSSQQKRKKGKKLAVPFFRNICLVPGPEWNLVTGPLKGKEGWEALSPIPVAITPAKTLGSSTKEDGASGY